jgi:hypothetical protein
MCRKTMFISMVILAAVSVSLAQNQQGCAQFSSFGGGGITFAAYAGGLSSDVDGSFSTGGSSDSLVCGPCSGTQMYQSNNYFTDQGSAAGGCGGLSMASGSTGTDSVLTTCGHNGASVGQAGAASEFQSIQTPSCGGSEYQYISGSQSGMAVGSPTSFASAGSMVAGGGTQSQSFGGLPPL